MRTALALAATIALTGCAHAWEPTEFYKIDKSERHPAVKVKAWRKVHKPKGPPVHVVIRLPKPEEDRCKPPVSISGDHARSDRAARLESQKNWKQEVRFLYGERYLSLEAAQDIVYQCGPSSIPSMGGRVEEAVGKLLPIEEMRCRITAKPCAAPVQREEDGK